MSVQNVGMSSFLRLESEIMNTKLACATLFLFALAAPVLGQQNLVRLDNDKSPCRRFKMIVLVPADNSTVDQNVRKPDESIDAKMVWNPCPQSTVQFAAVPTTPAPKRWNFISPEPAKLEFRLEPHGPVARPTEPSLPILKREP